MNEAEVEQLIVRTKKLSTWLRLEGRKLEGKDRALFKRAIGMAECAIRRGLKLVPIPGDDDFDPVLHGRGPKRV